MPCSVNFSMTLHTEILSTEISDFLKQIIIFKLFNSMMCSRFPRGNSLHISGVWVGSLLYSCFSRIWGGGAGKGGAVSSMKTSPFVEWIHY